MLKQGQEIHLTGLPICPGIAIGKPYYFATCDEPIVEMNAPASDVECEIARYYTALDHSRNDLVSLQNRLKKEGGLEAAAIVSSHLEMMRDPLMTVKIEEQIREKGKNTEHAFTTVIGEIEKKFSKITGTVFRERVKDFQDISKRIMGHLRQRQSQTLADLITPSIVFADDLSPTQAAEANIAFIEAFVTRDGSETSHVAIMARSRGIPFVANINFPDFSLSMPPQIIVDGARGLVIINPSKSTLQAFRQEKQRLQEMRNTLALPSGSVATADGADIFISANLENPSELDLVKEYPSVSVGLFRTEYLFLTKQNLPTEEEQFQIYKAILEKMSERTVKIRTFDIGGDKLGNFYINKQEKNPNLGCRAIRLMLKEKTLFKTQIRAILRASVFGKACILFPMISEIMELREAKKVVEEAKSELTQEGISFNPSIAIGCMIEVPSAAMTADILVKECDFFSIGTNDLVQYALAVDRGNAEMSYLYNPAHPSILRLIKMVIDEGKKAGVPVSVCGEVAADLKFTKLLLGLGVREFSCMPVALAPLSAHLQNIDMQSARSLAEHVLSLTSAEEINAALKDPNC